MYYLQKGWNVTISKVLSYIFIAGISSCLLLYGAGIWFSITDGNTFASIVAATFFYLFFIVGMAIFAMYNLWRFPTILTFDKGMDLRAFFFRTHIDWKQIVRVEKRTIGC
jgi:hypothetical protein